MEHAPFRRSDDRDTSVTPAFGIIVRVQVAGCGSTTVLQRKTADGTATGGAIKVGSIGVAVGDTATDAQFDDLTGEAFTSTQGDRTRSASSGKVGGDCQIIRSLNPAIAIQSEGGAIKCGTNLRPCVYRHRGQGVELLHASSGFTSIADIRMPGCGQAEHKGRAAPTNGAVQDGALRESRRIDPSRYGKGPVGQLQAIWNGEVVGRC